MAVINYFKIFIFLGTCCYICNMEIAVNNRESVCHTAICKKAARTIVESIDKTQDPCQDFYQYACGGYLEEHPLPEDSDTYGTFDEVGDKALAQLKEILEHEHVSDIPEILNAKVMYKQCMKKENSIELLKKYVHKLGGWPMLCDSELESFLLEDILADIGRKSVNLLVTAEVKVDLKDSSTNILQVSQGESSLSSGIFLDAITFKDTLESYEELIRVSAEILGSSCSEEQINKDIDEILRFETQLANLSSSCGHQQGYSSPYNKITIGELQKETDPDLKIFDWNAYLKKMMEMDFNNSEPVIVNEVECLKDVLQFVQSTSKRTVMNYIVWNFITTFSWHAGGVFLDAKLEFAKVQYGIKKEEPRWLTCSSIVDNVWGFAIGRPYVVKNFPSDYKIEIETMIENIHQAFLTRVDNVTFLDSATKGLVKEKSDAMLSLIGYPDWIKNDADQHEYYIDFPDMTSSHLENVFESRVAISIQAFKQLRKPVDKTKFHLTPASVDILYSPSSNAITFPAGFLQPPFYIHGGPASLNYGAIGMFIGYEITHGFDNRGRQFDKDGNLKQWWPESATQAFIKDAKCFIDQYNQYCPPELANTTKECLNGAAIQSGNIASNGGVEEAFLAYKTWLAVNGPELKLPGLEEYTPEQLFFLSSAHVWCSWSTPQFVTNEILDDPNSNFRYQVFGPLSNSVEFANAFQCAVGPMNRGPERCTVW